MTTPIQMTISRALVELKKLDKQIEKETNDSALYIATGSSKKIPNITYENAQAKTQGQYDKVMALIDRRSAIQNAIHASNAAVEVTVGGKKMSVLEAINLKKVAEAQETFLNRLIALRRQAVVHKERADAVLEQKVEAATIAVVGKDGKLEASQITMIRDTQETLYKTEIVDLAKVDGQIEALQKKVDDVKNELDFILSESNATNSIIV